MIAATAKTIIIDAERDKSKKKHVRHKIQVVTPQGSKKKSSKTGQNWPKSVTHFGNNDEYLTKFRFTEQTPKIADAYGQDEAFAAIRVSIIITYRYPVAGTIWNKMTSKNLIFANISVNLLSLRKKKENTLRTYQELMKSGVRIVVKWKPPHAYILEPDLDVFCKQWGEKITFFFQVFKYNNCARRHTRRL